MDARSGSLLAWQWRDYASRHRDRVNLLIHMVGVPAFIGAVLAFATLVSRAQWFGAALSLAVAAGALAIQDAGHRRERLAPEPFRGPADFVARLFAEQFITFPRFVLCGHWTRNLAEGPSRTDHG
jgi:hypothetical protein